MNEQYPIYVINLASREDRRAEFRRKNGEKGLAEPRFHFFEAIHEPSFGGLGCAKSHLLALTNFLCKSISPFCIILEDDFDLRISFTEVERLISEVYSYDPNWNVFILSGAHSILMETTNKIFSKVFESQTTSGYIIRRNYAQKLINIFSESVIGMEKYHPSSNQQLIYDRYAIDQCWKRIQREDNWYTTSPMAGQQRASYSDIEKQYVDYDRYSK